MKDETGRPTESPGFGRRVAMGIGTQGVTFALLMAVQLLLVPLFLASWGTAVYGDWLVVSAAATLLLLADLGVQGHFANGLRLSWARGDVPGFHRLLRSGLGVYAAQVTVCVCAFLLFVRLTDPAALLGVRHLDDPGAVFLLLGLSVLLMQPRGLVVACYSARGRFSREVVLNFLLYMAQFAAQAAALAAGATPVGAAASHAAITLLAGWGLLLADLRRQHPDIVPWPCRPARAELRAMLARAPLYAVPPGAIMLMQQVPVIALGHLGSAGVVVAFTTMRTITALARQTAQQIAIATGMEMARQHAQGAADAFAALHAGTGRLIGAAAGLFTGLLLVLGPAFFALWTHGAVAFDPVLAGFFLATVALMAPAYGALSLLHHGGHPRPLAAGYIVQAVAGVALCGLLIPPLGAPGAALAIGLSEVLALGTTGLLGAHRRFGTGVRAAGRSYAAMLLGTAIGVAVALLLHTVIPVTGFAGLLAFVVAWGTLSLVPAVLLLLTDGERAWLWREVRAAYRHVSTPAGT